MTDGSQDRITAIRDLLLRAFSLSELDALFFYAQNPRLQAARDEYTPSDALRERVLKVLDYCQRWGLLDELLAEIERARPEQSQALLDDLAGELPTDQIERLLERGSRVPQAKRAVDRAKESLEYNCQQIQSMSEYKNAHDLLQTVEGSYHVLYRQLYDESGVLRPLGRRDWRNLVASLMELQTNIYKLLAGMEGTSLRVTEEEWIESLRESHDNLQEALDDKDATLLDDTLFEIDHVISTTTSPINDRLVGAIDTLRLPDLVQKLQNVYQSVETHGDGATARELQEDAQAITELNRMSERLAARRKEHNAWQELDNRLRTELKQMEGGLNLRSFQRSWTRKLRDDMLALCEPLVPGLLQDPHFPVNKLDAALAGMPKDVDPDAAVDEDLVDAIVDAFFQCRGLATRLFVQVDRRLLRLCTAMERAGAWWSAALERVP